MRFVGQAGKPAGAVCFGRERGRNRVAFPGRGAELLVPDALGNWLCLPASATPQSGDSSFLPAKTCKALCQGSYVGSKWEPLPRAGRQWWAFKAAWGSKRRSGLGAAPRADWPLGSWAVGEGLEDRIGGAGPRQPGASGEGLTAGDLVAGARARCLCPAAAASGAWLQSETEAEVMFVEPQVRVVKLGHLHLYS